MVKLGNSLQEKKDGIDWDLIVSISVSQKKSSK